MSEPKSPTPIFVTVPAAKRLTGIDRPLEAAIAAGQVRVIRAGRWRRVRLADVIAFLEGRPGERGAA